MASWADGSATDFADFLNRACHFAFGEVYRYSPAVRIVRDAVNPIELYNEEDFAFRFRFTKASAITGPELQFFDVVASWPGSVHDSRIFTNSRVMALYEQKAVPGVLLGDQGYACLPFLMTPLRNPQTRAEKRYNKSQIKTRNSVERAFGVWKRRFACLRVKLLTDTDRSAAIVTACAALHNIACLRRDPCPVSDEVDPDVDLPDNPSQGDPDTVAGAQARSCYIRRCFSSGNEHTGPASLEFYVECVLQQRQPASADIPHT
ncbi:hypothetical protein HPB50_013367 [Hyalomma asiaticum]|uniref:Uncharacterized protein n=1 Tax=Hyalomma asiaticum TaxID=266040 RepID=A0ACB7RKJ8_HYAAI|nr:hypothetical protein HPB50_013367 [Hyalomma asiaticum]